MLTWILSRTEVPVVVKILEMSNSFSEMLNKDSAAWKYLKRIMHGLNSLTMIAGALIWPSTSRVTGAIHEIRRYIP